MDRRTIYFDISKKKNKLNSMKYINKKQNN